MTGKTILHLYAYQTSPDHRLYNGIVQTSSEDQFRIIRMCSTLSHLAKKMYDELPEKVPSVRKGITKEDFERLQVMGGYDEVVPVTEEEANDFIRMTYKQNGKKRDKESVVGIAKVLNKLRQS